MVCELANSRRHGNGWHGEEITNLFFKSPIKGRKIKLAPLKKIIAT